MKGQKIIRACERAGLYTYPGGNGSHTIIEVPKNFSHPVPSGGYGNKMACPHGELAKGTEKNILKWLAKLGVVVAMILSCGFISALFYLSEGA